MVVLNKADLADDVDGRVVAVEAVAPGVDIVPVSAWTGDGLDDLRAHLRAGTTAAILGSSGVGKSTLRQRAAGRGPPGDRRRSAAPTPAAATRRPTANCSSCPAARCSIDTPGIRSLEVLGAEAGLEAAFDEVAEIAATCRFSDCSHEGEPGCAVRVAIDEGRLDESRLASFRKLEREQARTVRQEDPRARAADRRKWKLIHKSVNDHMRRKYGDDR